MALRQITCPHCEQDVEVDVTSVTRSRDCPNCGLSILLHLTSTQKRARRTALMVPSVDAVEKLGEAPHADHTAPRALEGDVHDRMMHDPEVRQNMKRLLWGVGILAGVILILVVIDRFERSPAPAPTDPVSVADASAPVSPPLALPKMEQKPESPEAPAPVATTTTPPPVAVTTPAPAPAPPVPPPVIVTTAPPLSEEERAMQAVTAFLNAKDVEERLQVVRDVKLATPVIRAYYASHPDGPIPYTRITPEPKTSPNAPVRHFEVHLPDGQKRRATAGRVRSGAYFVDWASFVIYSAMEWDDFMQKPPSDPVFMRVFMEPAASEGVTPADANAPLCVKLTNPLNPASPPILACVARKSPAGQSLNLVLRTYAGEPYPMMLMLRHSPPAQGAADGHGQVRVDQLIGNGWLATGSQDFR